MVALMSVAVAGIMAPAVADEQTAWRLFVADHTKPVVHAIDMNDGREIGKFDVKGWTNLAPSASGKTVFAAQPDFDMVNVIATGIDFSDHGDHRDLSVSETKLLPVTFEGPRPYHVVAHDDHLILFYDRGGKAEIIDEAALLEGQKEVTSIDTTKPHHGVAVTMGNHVLVSVPNTEVEVNEGELPPRIGLRAVDREGHQVGDIAACTDLHGEATSARIVAFGCKEGILVASPGKDGPEFKMLPYPDAFPKAHSGTLLGGKAMQFFLANYGEDKVILIDAEAAQPFRLVELPTRRVDFILDPAKARNAYILTEDGDLHVLDVITGEIVRKARVTEPYSKDGHWRDPRPRLAVAGEHVVITDPRHSLIRLINVETLAEDRTIPVEGQPFSIVAIGGSGATH
nr:zinc metallochaperone AztD [Limoniibacter endophyticus]